jgi:hypothetical protein
MTGASAGIGTTGYFIDNIVQSNSELVRIAKRLRIIAADVRDLRLQARFAAEINCILDVAERSDRTMRAVALF